MAGLFRVRYGETIQCNTTIASFPHTLEIQKIGDVGSRNCVVFDLQNAMGFRLRTKTTCLMGFLT